MKSRAAVWRADGGGVTVEQVDVAPPQAREVLVKVSFSGVCHSDLHVVLNEWAQPSPMILGHEGAGVVADVGAGVTSVSQGDHVILSWTPRCGECEYCLTGKSWLCRVASDIVFARGTLPDGTCRFSRDGAPIHSYLGLGSFSEYAVVHESQVVRIPADFALDKAAVIGCAVATGVGAVINTAKAGAGSAVLVAGCGAVGLSVVQGAVLAGCDPILVYDVVSQRVEAAMRLGATHASYGDADELLREVVSLTEVGVDWGFEAVGHPALMETVFSAIRPGGTVVVVGQAPDGEKLCVNAYELSDREKKIVGCSYGSTRPRIDFPRLIRLYNDGKLPLLDTIVTNRIAVSGISNAFDDMVHGAGLRTVVEW